jgi:hypothetical protein
MSTDPAPRCPYCGSTSTTPNGNRHHVCEHCNQHFVPRRPFLERVFYTAVRTPAGCVAHVVYPAPQRGAKRSVLLDPRLDLWNHSPSGFEYGYGGSGPAQLALAILANHLGPGRENLAIRLHQHFKRFRISPAPSEQPLVVDSDEIVDWMHTDSCARAVVSSWHTEFPSDLLAFSD